MMSSIRPPAVAGMFYPSDPGDLAATVRELLAAARTDGEPTDVPRPLALIVPHAGYVYSGPIAASAYVLLESVADEVDRVVLLGPCHRVPVRGLAASSATAFSTPLGEVPVDREALTRVLAMPQVHLFDDPHEDEHSLEVHLPFLQVVLAEFTVCPILVGEASPAAVADLIERFGDGLVVVSSDLSHFHDYETARARDRATADAIEARDAARIGPRDACGCYPVGGLLEIARRRDWRIRTLDLRNSGDTQGPRGEVVGYGAFSAVS